MINPLISLEALGRFLEDLRISTVKIEDGKGLSTNDLTNELKAGYDAALTHAKSPHAPADAQSNIIEKIMACDEILPIVDKTVNIPIPKKVSELNNDLGFVIGHTQIPISVDTSTNTVIGYNETFKLVKNIDRDPNGHVKRVDLENITLPAAYNHPTSIISPGVYRSLTIDSKGHATAGTNPSTRDEYGLTDVPTIGEMKEAINNSIVDSKGLKRENVSSLPFTSSADPSTIYIIPKTTLSTTGNNYDEYMVINGAWEKIGDATYPVATKEEAETGLLTDIKSWTPERIAQGVRGTILRNLDLSSVPSSIITTNDTVILSFGKIQKQIIDHKDDKNNPHDTTKSQVGLSNVDNTSDLNKPVSIAQKTYIDDIQSILQNGLQTEISNRDAADTLLQNNINTLDSSFQASLQAEIRIRQNTDISLQNSIDNLRISSLSDLQDEILNRQNADNLLQININNVESQLTAHNVSSTAHVDIRNIIKNAIGIPIWDNNNFTLRFTAFDGTILDIDLPIEGLAKDIDYDSSSKEIIITKQNGTKFRISILDLVDIYIGYNGVHIQTIVDNGNVIKATLKAGTITETELSAALLKKINDKADQTNLLNHINDKSNPHEVTKAQVGLGNVDNTSDINKPISSAVQTALNGKQPSLNRVVSINDNAIGTITDTGGDLSIPISVTTTLGASNSTQLPAGTNSMRVVSQRILDNLANLFNRLTTVENTPSSPTEHYHAASDITSGRLILDRLPTSTTANRVMKVGTANSSPIYGQVDLSTEVIGITPIINGGTGANNITEARNNLGVIAAPVGSSGQVYYMKNDNSSEVRLAPILATGRFVETAEELAVEMDKKISFGTIFNTWTRFRIGGTAGEENSWSYDSVNDRVKCTVNSVGYIGFVSLDKYDNYSHEAKLTSTDADDDMIGVVIAYHKEDNGKVHTLTAMRVSGPTQSHFLVAGAYTRWAIVYNFNDTDAKLIANGHSKLNATTGGWSSYANGTSIRINREGDLIRAITTQINSTTYDATTELTVDLASDPVLAIFRGPKSYGYSCLSQNASTFSNIIFSDISSMIFNISTNQVLIFKNNTWVADSLKNIASEVGVGRFLFNLTTRKLFFIQDKDNIIRISPWSVAEHQAALNALPNI